ncbi:hypothetical protein ASD07_03555 [Duganella sp. Root336D2]|nr:hypothetical protein ASD07_03555 [Duganella sp. Root336D2]
MWGDMLSIIAILPFRLDVLRALKDGDSCNQRRTPATENVFRSVEITIMYFTAITACPRSYSKACDSSRSPPWRSNLDWGSTIRAGLGSKTFVDFHIPRAMPNGLVRQHSPEGRPACIKHGLRQAGLGESGGIDMTDSDMVEGTCDLQRFFM